jgi:putative ABC transport system permease protein
MIRRPRLLRSRSRRRAASEEVERELAYHLARRADELVAEGLGREEATRRARREFGDVERTRAYCERMSQRLARRRLRRRMLADVAYDARHALRGMRRSPGFTVVAVLIMALGIGATSAVFSVINAVVLRPLDYPDPQRLLQIWETNRRVGSLEDPVSPVDLRDWRAQSETLESIAGYGYQALAISGDGRPERLVAIETTADFFTALAVEPALGRSLEPGEEGPQHRVAVLSDRLWRGRFGADPSVIGREITLAGLPYLVVGVMPRGFAFPSAAELWVPYTFDVGQLSRGQHFLFALARLRAGVSLRRARAEMEGIAARLESEYPQYNANQGINLVPLQEEIVGGSARPLWIVFGAVAFLLVIACGNVGNLLLVRAAGRSGEIAIRRALGAGGWRLARQLLVEGVALALVAGSLGILATASLLDVLVNVIPINLPRSADIAIDVRVLTFSLLVAVLTGIGFGLVPALHIAGTRRGVAKITRSGSRATVGRGVRWLRDVLIVAEVALTLILLVTAGLLIANVGQLRAVDPGFRAEGVLTARIALPPEEYPGPGARTLFVERLREEIGALPGIVSFGTVDSLPFSGSRSTSSFDIEGDIDEPTEPRTADRREVTPGYFDTMDIALLRGRRIEPTDDASAPPVVVVNATFARRFFPEGDALGRRVQVGGPEETALYGEPVWREIVGVVDDIIHDDLKSDAAAEMYLPYPQHPSTRLSLAVRTRGPPAEFVDTLRDAVLAVDADQPLYGVLSMDTRLETFLALDRASAWTLAVFSSIALLLAVLGIYSVVSYAVAQRTHELGVRRALGARTLDIVRMVLRQAMTRVGAGLLLGLGGAMIVGRAVRTLLFNVDTGDPAALTLPAALLTAAALLACLVPTLRALRIDPANALRRD